MKSFFLFAALALGVLAGHPAQAQPSTGGPAPATPTTPAAVPLDGGASLLLASGVAYGLRHLRQRRKASR